MKTVNEYRAIINFCGSDMTEEQASRLMDDMKHDLSIDDIQALYESVEGGVMFTELSMYNGEMGGLMRK